MKANTLSPKKRFFIVFLSFTLLFITNCKEKTATKDTKSANTTVQSIDPKTFSEKLQTSKNAQLIDVRSPEEFNSKHIENALNIDYNSTTFENSIGKLDKTKPTFVYCLSGGRSSSAVSKMHDLGFKELYNMEGGMMKWNALGLGTEIKQTKGMSKSDFDKILQTDKKVLIDFNAKWCGPCKKMAPILEKIKKDYNGKVIVVAIDVDENESLAAALKIESLPTLILYENKKIIWQTIGFTTEEDLKKHL